MAHKWFKKVLKDEKPTNSKLQGEKLATFKNFSKTSKLKQAALTAISVQASPVDIRELKELFMSLDVNGDGSLTISELQESLRGKENGDTIL